MTRSKAGSRKEIRPGVWRVWGSAGTDASGKRVRPNVTIRGTDEDAAKVQSMMVADITRKSPYELTRRSIRVGEFVPEWLDLKAADVSKRTLISYEQIVTLYIVPAFGHVMFDRLDPHAVKLWLARLKKTPKQRQPKPVDGVPAPTEYLSGSTVRAAYTHLNMLIEDAILAGYLEDNPLARVPTPAPPRKHAINVLSQDEAEAYLTLFEDSIIEPFVLTALGAGLRRNEVAARSWGDYEFWTVSISEDAEIDVCSVMVEDGLKQWGGEVWLADPKTEGSRARVLIVGRFATRLKKLRAFGPIVPDGRAHMKPDKVARIYKKAITDAGLRFVSIRDLRHSFAMFALDADVPVRVLQEMMRHTSVRTTEGYVEANLTRQIEAAPKMARKWGSR